MKREKKTGVNATRTEGQKQITAKKNTSIEKLQIPGSTDLPVWSARHVCGLLSRVALLPLIIYAKVAVVDTLLQ